MRAELSALAAHARHVPVDRRTELASAARKALGPGSVVLETCHRVEVYGDLVAVVAADPPPGSQVLRGEAVAAHLIGVAVGRDSAVVAEDQILHQLRSAVRDARARGPMPVALDRLFDTALRAGRRARTWLPARRRSLAQVALERVSTGDEPPRTALVVGAGEMGRQAAHALSARGTSVSVCSRTRERAMALAAAVDGSHVDFAPRAGVVAAVDAVVVALSGPWSPGSVAAAELVDGSARVVDLSAPPAVPADIVRALGRRFVSIDDLTIAPPPSAALLARLDRLVDEALEEYRRWTATDANRAAARALASRAVAARDAELSALWQRIPALEPSQREEVERMARHLTERLLRDPVEQLHRDEDGRHVRAARELFRL